MLCKKCSHDKFRVADVLRERRYSFEKGWVYDAAVDTRRVLCRKCGLITLTETRAIGREYFDENEFQIKIEKN